MNKQVTLRSTGNMAEVIVDQREKPLLAIIAIYSFSIKEWALLYCCIVSVNKTALWIALFQNWR